MIQFGGFIDLIAPFKAMLSVHKFIDNKLKNVSKNKDKIFDAIKRVDNSVKEIKKLFGAVIILTDKGNKRCYKSN